MFAVALIDYIFYYSCSIFFVSDRAMKHIKMDTGRKVISEVQDWFFHQITFYNECIKMFEKDKDNFVFVPLDLDIDIENIVLEAEDDGKFDIEKILASDAPLDFGI